MEFNLTCNSTLDDMRITSEVPIAGGLTFHSLGLIISGAFAAIAIILSLYLIWMHALHYTKPQEQRHIIRILFMVPVYATTSFLSFWFYYHAVYYQVISDCYEAFTIASFFALLCHYIKPNLHAQKEFFRSIEPKDWVWPLNWMRRCCCGDRGPWRTPKSGLTWFNIIWLGIYQYSFIMVSMTITAFTTQYLGRYCGSSNSPVFAHIWVLVIEGVAVTIAMYCVIQFYIQLHNDLKPHSPLIKVTAIKLVIFLSFWQTFLISILTSSFDILKATSSVAYPDIKVGIPSFLLCVEMACFAVLHIFAYPYAPYVNNDESGKYSSSRDPSNPDLNAGSNQGGPLGIGAIIHAMNMWDLIKAFGRGIRWVFVRRHREKDNSYKLNSHKTTPESATTDPAYRLSTNLPIANQFRWSRFGSPIDQDEGARLIANPQPIPYQSSGVGGDTAVAERYDPKPGQEISTSGKTYNSGNLNQMYHEAADKQIGVEDKEDLGKQIGIATSRYGDDSDESPTRWSPSREVPGTVKAQRPQLVRSTYPQPQSMATPEALWDSNQTSPQTPQGPGMQDDYGRKI